MNTEVTFQCDWIEQAVRKCLKKAEGPLFDNDLEAIKYVRIGEGFDNGFFIHLSTEKPPSPFADTDGGDEWGDACAYSENGLSKGDLEYFISTLGGSPLYPRKQLEPLDFAWEKRTREEWNRFKTTIVSQEFYRDSDHNGNFDYDGNFDCWYDLTVNTFPKDIPNFTHAEVLRINGGKIKDFTRFDRLTHLRVMELVETSFESLEGFQSLTRLKQLCCWLD